ncbi:hypothetical protein IT570_04185 [Candidatus Sumerlaeota bacterium]|nr:hypothetical protein [Candidatus Sumerlaeota bacterium]
MTDVQVFAERYGANMGRLHVIYRAVNTSGGTGVFYTKEGGVGTNSFSAPLLVSPLDNKTYTEPDISVDRNSVVHIVFVGKNPTIPANDAVFYAKVSAGGALTAAQKITPDTVTIAFSPQVAAVQHSGRSNVQAHVAYVSNDIGGGIDSDVYLLTSDAININNFGTPLNLTSDSDLGEQNVTFDLVEGLNSGGGPTDYLIQGALVYQRSNTLRAIMVTAATNQTIFFGAPVQIVASAQDPALAVQSVFQSANGYVGHLAFRPVSGGGALINYIQFAQAGGTIYQETQSSFPAATSVSHASITVEPYLVSERTGNNFINARFDKDVTVSYADQSSRSLNAARNSGGISSSIAGGLGIAGNVPLTPFTDTGFVSFFPSTFFSYGPKAVATTRVSGTDYIRVGGVLDNNVVLVQELGITPTPTATPTVSPSPSSVTTTVTATPTHSPSPSSTSQPTASATATPSPTAAGSATPSASPTSSPIIIPTASLTASPSPSVSPVFTISPTPSPSPSPSIGPTLTATPNIVTRTEIIDTLLGLRPAPSSARVAQHDTDANGFWDAGDVASFNLAR